MIPEWFDIRNYVCGRNFDKSQWLYELEIRRLFYPQDMLSEKGPSVFGHKGISNREEKRRQHREHLITAFGDIVEQFEDEIVFNSTVWVRSHERNLLRKSVNMNDLVYRITDPDDAMLQTKWNLPFEPVFTANLLHSDRELRKAFSQFLKSYRQDLVNSPDNGPIPRPSEVGKVRDISPSKLHDYFSCGLLPSLDLKQWQIISDQPVSTDEMGAAIFSPDYSVHTEPGRTIRDTTKDHAKTVNEIIYKLSAQAVHRWVFADDDISLR